LAGVVGVFVLDAGAGAGVFVGVLEEPHAVSAPTAMIE